MEELNAWKLQFSHTKSDNSYATVAKLSKAGVPAEFSHQLSFMDMGNWDNKMSLTSPWEYWKSIAVTGNQKWNTNGFSHSSKGTWNGKELATSAYYTYSLEGGKRIIEAKGILDDPQLKEIAGRYNKSTAQVILRWHVQ